MLHRIPTHHPLLQQRGRASSVKRRLRIAGQRVGDDRIVPCVTAGLEPSEHVQWSGKPVRRPVFESYDLLAIPVTIVAAGIMPWFSQTTTIPGVVRAIWTWGIVAVVAYNVVGRPIVRWLTLRGTTYTVTDRRILLEVKVLGLTHREAHYFRALPPPTVVDRVGGLGDVRFGKASWKRVSEGWRRVPPQLELRAIADPHAVARLVPYQY
jgi:hypothetical protein